MKPKDKSLDVRGQTCPYPEFKTRNALAEMGPGQVLEVLTDYELSAKKTIPENICKKNSYLYEVKEEKDDSGNKFWRFLIEKS